MKKLRNFKNVKSFSILLIPDHSGLETASYKLTVSKILLLLSVYTLLVAFAGFLFFNLTPVGGWIFGKGKLTDDQMEMVNQLNDRMIFLTKELEGLKSTNERLKYAIILGDSSLRDSINKIQENSSQKKKLKPEGNLLAVFRRLFFQPQDKEVKSYYFTYPANGFVSRGFKPERGHLGIDFVLKNGTPVYAAASGYIIFSDYTVKNGYMIIISHPDNYLSIYKHCSSLVKKERENVTQGEIIALSGNSGEITTGPHLHFEIWQDGKPIDPEKILLKYKGENN